MLIAKNRVRQVLDSTTRPFSFRITGGGREFLLEQGTDRRYGARHLKRAIERYVVCPIARLLATAQVHRGDALVIDHHLGEEGLVFLGEVQNRSTDSKMDFRSANSGQLMAAARELSSTYSGMDQ
jgi:ATP-dependent Clp protease ATP-binding subunit ClpA